MRLGLIALFLLSWRLEAQTPVAIGAVQGTGDASPLAGQVVTVEGTVTARKSNGFFVQSSDGDPRTSDGIFVFTSAAPPSTAAVGNEVRVTGTVQEFQTLTEIAGPTVTLLSSGNPPPPPVEIAAPFERFEGMRVRVESLTVVAPTGGNVSEANATSTSNGILFGVVTGTARPVRKPGLAGDRNPERLRVTGGPNVAAGMILTGLTGVLDYSAQTYTILPEAGSYQVGGTTAVIPVSVPAPDEFTVASFNMERFFDTTNDPSVSDVALTPAAYENRLRKAALVIRDVLQSPDILAVQEVENLAVLQEIANRAGPSYTAYLVEGNDPGGIDVGFLVKSSRVTVVNVTQEGKAATYTAPSGSQELLNDRPPFVLRAMVGAFPITVIVNHLRSLNGIDDPEDGPRVRAKRGAQAEYLANLIQTRQIADPSERIVVVGDFNAFPFNDGYVDVVGTVRGTHASPDQVNPDLVDASESLAPEQRYSYVFDGNAQALDQMLFTQNLQPYFVRMEHGRSNADFPEILRSDPTRPERLSDHDPAVAYFRLTGSGVGVGIAPASEPIGGRNFTYRINLWNTTASPATVTVWTSASDAAAPEMPTIVSMSLPAGAFEFVTVDLSLRHVANGAALRIDAGTTTGATASSTVIVASPPPRRLPALRHLQ